MRVSSGGPGPDLQAFLLPAAGRENNTCRLSPSKPPLFSPTTIEHYTQKKRKMPKIIISRESVKISRVWALPRGITARFFLDSFRCADPSTLAVETRLDHVLSTWQRDRREVGGSKHSLALVALRCGIDLVLFTFVCPEPLLLPCAYAVGSALRSSG